MKIIRVDVKKWRILEKPQAEFRTACAVIIGENGSGKSTLLELILSIFGLVYRKLKEPKAASDIDGFYLEYLTKDPEGSERQVIFESGYFEGNRTGELYISIDGKGYSIKSDGGENLKIR